MSKFSIKLRSVGWAISAFVQKQKKALIVSIIVGILLFLTARFFVPYLADISIGRDKIRIGLVGAYNINNLPEEITNKLSYGLVRLTEDAGYEPMAAANITISEDYKTYTVDLAPTLLWSDDKEVKSKQLNLDIEGSQIEYPHNNQVIFHLKQPFSPFLSLLQKPIFREDLIGLGPYALKNISYENRLVKNITIFNQQHQIPSRFYPSTSNLITAFRLGEIDQFTSSYDDLLDQEKDKVKVNAVSHYSTYLALFFNTQDQLLSEKTVRQALAYAIKDKSFGFTPAITSIRPHSFAYTDEVKKYDYDAAKAKEFWEDLNLKEINLKIATTQEYLDIAEKIKQNWESVLGIKVDLEIINFIPQDYQVLLLPQATQLDPDQYIFWHSTQTGTNVTKLQNPKIDKLLEDGRLEHDLTKRAEIYQQFQQVISEEVPAIFLFYPQTYIYQRL